MLLFYLSVEWEFPRNLRHHTTVFVVMEFFSDFSYIRYFSSHPVELERNEK